MATRKLNFLLWFSALALLLACVPSLGTPVPTADPNQINLFIAQTANAAATQTVAAMPTSTFTETPTPTPRNTSTPSPTYTSTVIFRLSTLTSAVLPTFTAEGDSSQNFACQVIGVEPAHGIVLSPRTDFDAIWRVTNVGKKQWNRDNVDYIYKSGAKLHNVNNYDLSKNVKTDETISIIVDMKAPKTPGTYTTMWTLRSGVKQFCKMPLTITVK